MSSFPQGDLDLHGVLLLDKHKGVSSNHVVQKIKHLFNVNKVGHAGTLDPLATGMLPVCLGEATKLTQYLINSDKHYRVIARLGENTDTSDATGRLIRTRPINFNQNKLNEVLDSFRGNTLQIPSMFSALKYHGRPLYKYARQGINIERKARPIVIYKLLLIRWEYNELELEIHCSKGTYIRTIIDDLGEKLCCGAHVIMLRRLQVATYSVDKMVTLETVQKLMQKFNGNNFVLLKLINSLLLPIDSQVSCFPEVNLYSPIINYFKQGQRVKMQGITVQGLVRITEGKDRKFIGMGEVDHKGFIMPRRLRRLY
ncbi:tRNA pseudouridine(55) synthase TruB [Pantoea sp. Mhis]|uniref:tRNA pseudouridine(55) synthase TruB n=1 Tax=Pantoea sp. Mhis TaxID=2576759 RepID=UPI00135B1303|nr:tRNA pseudouridine(55) synthase TruB [Pantoea sp. Mhis]MXP56449.1 tRNA pseudouridine(55) synthase TruB [Pantoea sp. Mhis]